MGMNGFTQGECVEGEKSTSSRMLRSGRKDAILVQGCRGGADNKLSGKQESEERNSPFHVPKSSVISKFYCSLWMGEEAFLVPSTPQYHCM